MMIYIHLALAFLKKQRSRTIALVLGVALAIMFVFGYNVISESQSRSQLSNIYKMYGTYQGIFTNLDRDTITKIKNDKLVSKSAVSISLGNLVTKDGISIALNSADKDYIEKNGYTLTKGRLPESQGEIILESQALKKMGLRENIGQVIDFKVKKQYKDENGINQIYMKTKSLKLVGIIDKPKQYYNGNYLLTGFTYFRDGESNILPDNMIKYEIIIKLKSNANLSKQLDILREKYNIGRLDYEINNQLIVALNDFSAQSNGNFKNQFNILVIITAILLIYNMFNISLTDMIKQIGMLRAIGSSKKHVRLFIGFQSLFILITGLILGLLMGVIFSYFGMKLYSLTSTTIDVSESSIYISMRNIWNAMVIGTITVIVSSIIPVWMSGRISPVEAMRKSDKSGSQKKRPYHKAIKKLFGITGEMAYKNVWRNKWRTLIIVVSVAIAGYIFINYIAIYNEQNEINNKTDMRILSMQDNDFKLSFDTNMDSDFAGYTKNNLKALSNIKGVKKIGTKISMDGFLESNINNLQKEFKEYNDISDMSKNAEATINVKGYDDKQLEEFRKYIDKGDISSLNKTNEYPNAVVFNYYYDVLKDHKFKEIRKNLRIGDILTIRIPVIKNDEIRYEKYKIRVAALLKQEWTAKGDSTKGKYMEVILPQKDLMAMSGKITYDQISVHSEEGKDSYIYNQIKKIIHNKPFPYIESKIGYIEQNNKGFAGALKSHMVIVVLILFIAALNVYNTIKTSLLIRTKEFSTFRAIGMTVKQLKNMIIKESVFYSILSSIVAAVIGSYKVYSFYSLVNRQFKGAFNINKTIQFDIPIIPILLYVYCKMKLPKIAK